jgi:hypothetical protein
MRLRCSEYRPTKRGTEGQPIATILNESHFLRNGDEDIIQDKKILAGVNFQAKKWSQIWKEKEEIIVSTYEY